jgi:hypothetical protein
VFAVDPVELRGGAVAVRAERELRRRDADDDETDGEKGDTARRDAKDGASRAEASDGATQAGAGENPSPEEIARRERRYRRYLDRHGYKPIREVLEQIERSAGTPADGKDPTERKP